MDKSRFIFQNEMSSKAYNKALKSKERFYRKYGDDSGKEIHLSTATIPSVGDMLGITNIVSSEKSNIKFDDKSIIIGNIRMGYGHYRISMGWHPPQDQWDMSRIGSICIRFRMRPAER